MYGKCGIYKCMPFIAGSNGDRPHTISTAYEKGHQRPQLQPYTFSPPESTLTIHECDQDTEVDRTSTSSLHSISKKPPVPKRIGQLSGGADTRPMVPNKTMAATMAAVKQQQLLMQQQQLQASEQHNNKGLPNFTFNRTDMVVPQPVYMNMNDLKALAAQKQQQQLNSEFNDLPEDSPELKTPTAEDIMVPEQKVSIFPQSNGTLEHY